MGWFKIKELSRNVHVVEFECKDSKSLPRILLSSDHHWDNPKSNQDMIKKHLEQAKKDGSPVFMFGDFYCAMQGKYDKRSSKKDIRLEHQTLKYLDSLVDTGTDFLEPYAGNIALMSPGNHETAILSHHETDLTERTVENLRRVKNSVTHKGGYSGWIIFRVNIGKMQFSTKLFYHHGYGGAAPVTKGVIQASRMGIVYPDADVIVTGHTHGNWIFPIPRYRVSNGGNTYKDEQFHVKTPTYKDDFQDGYGGWGIEKGFSPTPIGAVWMTFNYKRDCKNGNRTYLTPDFSRAD